jgi:hypothetical protein
VLSDADTKALMKLNTDAKNLENYRENGTVYAEKCAEVLERIKIACDPIKIEKLSEDQANILNSIKKIIGIEEQFARSSFKIRSPEVWKDFLND